MDGRHATLNAACYGRPHNKVIIIAWFLGHIRRVNSDRLIKAGIELDTGRVQAETEKEAFMVIQNYSNIMDTCNETNNDQAMQNNT